MNLFITDLIVKYEIACWSFCTTDGCLKQFIFTTALYPCSLLARDHSISVKFLVRAPGHEKGYVDGLNSVDKHYLKRL